MDGRYKRIRDDWKLKYERKKRKQERIKERKSLEVYLKPFNYERKEKILKQRNQLYITQVMVLNTLLKMTNYLQLFKLVALNIKL